MALAQQRDLLRLGLLHLQDELGLDEHGLASGAISRALREEMLVVDRAALPGAVLHQHLVSMRTQLAHPCGGDRDAVLVPS